MRRLLQITTLFIVIGLLISCGSDSNTTGPDSEPEPTTGSVEITTSTSGDDQDDGYEISVDGTTQGIGANETVTVSDLQEGSYDAELTDISENCVVDGDNPRSVDITVGETTSTSFNITCESAANGKIAFISDRGESEDIFLMDADGSSPTNLTTNTDYDGLAAISHDGNRIAFVSDRSGSHGLYVMDIDGSNVQLIKSGLSNAYFAPSWSPDDSKLAFVDESGGDTEIYTIGIDGNNEQQLTNNSADDYYTDWSPDGSKILYNSDTDGDQELYTVNPDGSDRQRVTENSDADYDGRWSPEGSKIAFVSDRSGNDEIYTINSDGSDVQQVTDNSASDIAPTWSPDGTEIAFRSRRDGNGEIYKMAADGNGSPVNLTENVASDSNPHWRKVE